MAELFVVGVGRSGTSLLQSMLAAHPSIAMLPETGFFRRYCTSPAGLPAPAGELRERDERLQRLSAECWKKAVKRGAQDPGITGLDGAVALYQALLSPEVAGCQAGADAGELRFVGEKDPRLIEYLPLLSELFPDAQVIHIVRDPRDVLLSKSKAAWSEGRDWRINMAAGRFQLDLAQRYKETSFHRRFHDVAYEELLSAPEETLRRVLSGLGLTYTPAVLNFPEAAARLSGGAMEEWKKETLQPLNASNFGKWRDGLSAPQIEACEGVFYRKLELFGYPSAGVLSLRGWFYRAAAWFASLAYRVYRLTRVRRQLGRLSRSRRETRHEP